MINTLVYININTNTRSKRIVGQQLFPTTRHSLSPLLCRLTATETVHKLYVCTHTSIVRWILALFRHTCRLKLIARSHHGQSGRFWWTYLSAIGVIAWRNYLTTSNYLSPTEGNGQILLSAIRSISWHVWDALRSSMYKHLMFSWNWLAPLQKRNLADTTYIVWIVVCLVWQPH